MSVIKVGGSVLRDGADFEHVARLLARRDEPWVAVVSAAKGVTDRLLDHDVDGLFALHAQWAPSPLPQGLADALEEAVLHAEEGHGARLLAWGEQASVAVLASHLLRLGADACVAELGTCLPRVPRLLVPGFYQRQGDDIVVLSRGASDVSAVEVAIQTGAPEVQFWKDGGGILHDGQVVATTDHLSLLQRIGTTIRPLHPDAVRRAADANIRLRLEDPWCRHAPTTVA